MNAEPDDFQQVRRLLSLKRHEQPPPGFFNAFSEKVISRLQAPEPVGSMSWWQRLGLDFDFKPALVCASGVGVCALLVFGIITAMQLQNSSSAVSRGGDLAQHGLVVPPTGAEIAASPLVSVPEITPSTTPVISAPPSSSPFNQFSLHAQRASFAFGN